MEITLIFLDASNGNVRVPHLMVRVVDSNGQYVTYGRTDSDGELVLSLDAGSYEFETKKAGFTATNQALEVPSDTYTYYVDSVVVGPPPNPRMCRLFADFVSLSGYPYEQFKIQIQTLFDPQSLGAMAVVEGVAAYETDESGHVEFDVPRGARLRATLVTTPFSREFVVPDKEVENLLTLLASDTDAFKIVKR